MNSTLWAPEFLNTTWPEQQQQQAKVFLYLKDGYLKKITLIDFQNDPLDFFLFSDSNNMYVDMQCRSCLFRGCGLPSFTDWFSGCCWEEEEEEGRDKETPEMEKHILLCVLPKTSVLFFSFCVCVSRRHVRKFFNVCQDETTPARTWAQLHRIGRQKLSITPIVLSEDGTWRYKCPRSRKAMNFYHYKDVFFFIEACRAN